MSSQTPNNSTSNRFAKFCFGGEPGLGRWLSEDIHPVVLARLERLSHEPLSKVQFNQLLVISQAGSVSDGFFRYFWKSTPAHPYDVSSVDGYDPKWFEDDNQVIQSESHLCWGLSRIYIDALLFFGDVNTAFDVLRSMNFEQLAAFFEEKRFETGAIAARGPALPLGNITKDNRYLISEMACKTLGELPADKDAALGVLKSAWEKHEASGGGSIRFRDLLAKHVSDQGKQEQMLLSYDDFAGEQVDSAVVIEAKFQTIADKFIEARKVAIRNTELYLSMVNDLDVYVATSMRTRDNFRSMAEACEAIFGAPELAHLHLRYFDPTLSAARGHEDKGLIECLMVKCAKVLVYCEGEKESYGKDAEAAMALSMGKPVIFYCDRGKKTAFYRDVHPLARLIDFRSGVAVGAIVSDDVKQVAALLQRIFENRMEYDLEHHPSRPGYLKLIERLTKSVVRLQTDDPLIARTFWNNYHRRGAGPVRSLAAGAERERS